MVLNLASVACKYNRFQRFAIFECFFAHIIDRCRKHYLLQRPAFAKRIFFNPFNIGELDFLKVHATSECSIGQGLKVTGKDDLVETVTFGKDTSSQLGYGIWQGRRLQIVTTGERTAFYSGNSVRDLNRMQVLKPED